MDEYPYVEHNGLNYYCYKNPDDSMLLDEIINYETLLERCLTVINMDMNNFFINIPMLSRALIRTDQRKLHYKMYHNITFSELKQTAILCYWINKYKPITQTNPKRDEFNNFTNEIYCMYLIIGAIHNYREHVNLPRLTLNSETIRDLMYLLQHRNVTYDSLVTAIELVACSGDKMNLA